MVNLKTKLNSQNIKKGYLDPLKIKLQSPETTVQNLVSIFL